MHNVPCHCATVDVNGKQHVIAYGPMSSWLLLSSGPSACVFDDTGRLVDWSSDIGTIHNSMSVGVLNARVALVVHCGETRSNALRPLDRPDNQRLQWTGPVERSLLVENVAATRLQSLEW